MKTTRFISFFVVSVFFDYTLMSHCGGLTTLKRGNFDVKSYCPSEQHENKLGSIHYVYHGRFWEGILKFFMEKMDDGKTFWRQEGGCQSFLDAFMNRIDRILWRKVLVCFDWDRLVITLLSHAVCWSTVYERAHYAFNYSCFFRMVKLKDFLL